MEPKKQKKWKVQTDNNICIFLIILSLKILESDGKFLNKTHAMFPIELLIQESMTRFCLRTNLYLPAGQLDSNMYIFIDLIQSIIIIIIIVVIISIIIMKLMFIIVDTVLRSSRFFSFSVFMDAPMCRKPVEGELTVEVRDFL